MHPNRGTRARRDLEGAHSTLPCAGTDGGLPPPWPVGRRGPVTGVGGSLAGQAWRQGPQKEASVPSARGEGGQGGHQSRHKAEWDGLEHRWWRRAPCARQARVDRGRGRGGCTGQGCLRKGGQRAGKAARGERTVKFPGENLRSPRGPPQSPEWP